MGELIPVWSTPRFRQKRSELDNSNQDFIPIPVAAGNKGMYISHHASEDEDKNGNAIPVHITPNFRQKVSELDNFGQDCTSMSVYKAKTGICNFQHASEGICIYEPYDFNQEDGLKYMMSKLALNIEENKKIQNTFMSKIGDYFSKLENKLSQSEILHLELDWTTKTVNDCKELEEYRSGTKDKINCQEALISNKNKLSDLSFDLDFDMPLDHKHLEIQQQSPIEQPGFSNNLDINNMECVIDDIAWYSDSTDSTICAGETVSDTDEAGSLIRELEKIPEVDAFLSSDGRSTIASNQWGLIFLPPRNWTVTFNRTFSPRQVR